jgi:hypothetical protein
MDPSPSHPCTEVVPGARHPIRIWLALLALAVTVSVLTAAPTDADAVTLPSGFLQLTVFSGLTNPTVVRFASDGRVFVGTKSGRIYVYDSTSDATPTLFADLSPNVHDFWDRGLLGLALDPQFPARPYVYVLYTYDQRPGGSNLITNPSFETDTSGWTYSGDAPTTMARQTGWSASGAASLRYTATVGTKGWSGADFGYRGSMSVTPGTTYAMSVVVNVLSLTRTQKVGGYLSWWDANWNYLGQSAFNKSSSLGVRTISGTATAPAGAVHASIAPLVDGGTGQADFYVDSASFGDPNSASTWGDQCPTPPGPTTNGCVVGGRLSRLTAAGNTMSGPEQVLIEDWCQQFPSHSIGTLAFAPDGSLYVTGGEGASFDYADYGQTGNPCGDPPGPAGTNLSPPTAEGGALLPGREEHGGSDGPRRCGAAGES